MISLANTAGPLLRNVVVNVPGGTAQTGSLLVPPALRTHVYDLDGNLENDGLWKYGWDAENRLVAMENVTTLAATARRRVTFEYDDRSRRIGKQVYPWSGSGYAAVPTLTAKYLYDGWNLVAELNDANQPVRTYTWGNDLSGTSQGAGGVGGLLKVTSYTYSPSIVTHLLPVYDGNGNVTGLVDANARMVAATYEYGPFGELLRASGPQARSNPLRFSTKYQDDETELSYYGYRYYSANLGRWINRDPSEEHQGDSLYSFVGNNSINHLDFNGLWKIIVWPIHEEITTTALERSNWRLCYRGDGQKLRSALVEGVQWPDIPDGKYALAEIDTLYGKDPGQAGLLAGNTLTFQTHFGEFQYWHSMSFQEPNAGFLMFNIWSFVEENARSAMRSLASGDVENAGFSLGKLLHTVQDSYSRSHLVRGPNGEVQAFQAYPLQNHKKHGDADKLKGSFEYQLAIIASEKVIATLMRDPDEERAIANLFNLIHGDIYQGWPNAKTRVTAGEFK